MIDESKLTKLYYSIGEVAKMLDVNASLIRFWEKEFSVLKLKKNNKGNRLFTPKDVATLGKIYHLVKIEGHTLDGAKKALKRKEEFTNEIPSNEDEIVNEVIAKLTKIKGKLINLKR